MPITLSRRRTRKQIATGTARLLNRFYWREIGYFYFGEFGYFNLEILGGLELLFRQSSDLRLKIATYASYATLLNDLFPGRVDCVTPDWPYDQQYRVCHDYRLAKFNRAIFWQGFTQPLQSLLDDFEPRGRVHEARFFYLSAPLSGFEPAALAPRSPESPEPSFISIFPRGRVGYASKNLDSRQWDGILRTLVEHSSLPIVVHGVAEEMTELPTEYAQSLIRPKNILEQAYYLRHSRFCISPDSGFVQFSLNCACDVLVIGGTIQYHEFVDFNPFGVRLVIASQEPAEYLPEVRRFASDPAGSIRIVA